MNPGTPYPLSQPQAPATEFQDNFGNVMPAEQPKKEMDCPKSEDNIDKSRGDDDVANQLAAKGINIKETVFLRVGVTDGSKKVSQFTETLPQLPEGWRLRKKANGKDKFQNCYLSPDLLTFHSAAAVIEYLHLEGKLSREEVMKAARGLKLKLKLKKIFPDMSPEEFQAALRAENPVGTVAKSDSAPPPKIKKETKDFTVSTATLNALSAQGIDITKSSYLMSGGKNLVSMSSTKCADKFTETVDGLPEGWKSRTINTVVNGKPSTAKQFLSPNGVILRTTLAVVEYLRMEGKLSPPDVLDIAKCLRVTPKKLSKLFVSETTSDENAPSDAVVEADNQSVDLENSMDVDTSESFEGSFSSTKPELGDDSEPNDITDEETDLNTSIESAADNLLEELNNLEEQQQSWRNNLVIDTDIEDNSGDPENRQSESECLDGGLDDEDDKVLRICEERTTEKEDLFENSFDTAADNLMKEMEQTLEDLDKDIEESSIVEPQEIANHVDTSNSNEKAEEIPSNNQSKRDSKKQKFFEAQEIDVRKSPYLSFCLENGTLLDGRKASSSFTETLQILPGGWKYKTADGKVNGKTKSVKHYLSPTNILFKFSMGVVEYLRLEGKMKHEDLLHLAKGLKVAPKKMKKWFDSKVPTDSQFGQ